MLSGRRRPIIAAVSVTAAAAYALHVRAVYRDYQERAPPVSLARYIVLRSFPTRSLSSLAGRAADIPVPQALRSPLYGLYSAVFGCNVDECAPLASFPTFQAFFTRQLKDGARPVSLAGQLVSPCDGWVAQTGSIACPRSPDITNHSQHHHRHVDIADLSFDPIKGVTYKASDLVGPGSLDIAGCSRAGDDKGTWWRRWPFSRSACPRQCYLHYATIYLAPGDYHRFHAPADMEVCGVERIPGEKHLVAPSAARMLPRVLQVNERACISGRTGSGTLWMVPVGSLNVGSIQLDVQQGAAVSRGQEVGHFKMGSTIVLLYLGREREARFAVSCGTHIKTGQTLLV